MMYTTVPTCSFFMGSGGGGGGGGECTSKQIKLIMPNCIDHYESNCISVYKGIKLRTMRLFPSQKQLLAHQFLLVAIIVPVVVGLVG